MRLYSSKPQSVLNETLVTFLYVYTLETSITFFYGYNLRNLNHFSRTFAASLGVQRWIFESPIFNRGEIEIEQRVLLRPGWAFACSRGVVMRGEKAESARACAHARSWGRTLARVSLRGGAWRWRQAWLRVHANGSRWPSGLPARSGVLINGDSARDGK